MLNNHQLRVIYLYEWKLGHNASQAAKNINLAFGEGTATDRNIRRWFDKFISGDMNLENEDRGRPLIQFVDQDLKKIIESDTRQSVRDIAQTMGSSKSTISRHLTQMGKVKKMDKWVPHELTEKHKLRRLEISSSLISRHAYDPFLERIVTCDEKWILYDNRRRSAQWLDKNEEPKPMPKPNLHAKKIMVTVWWCATGIIHYSFLGTGESITAVLYCSQIDDMHKKLCMKHPALTNRKHPILLHDNARPHISKLTVQKLIELKYEILPHPPYSPDLSPTDYYLFKNLDKFLKEKKFNKEEDVKNAFVEFINSREQDFFKVGINKLLGRWEKCVDSLGAYFN